MAPLPKRRHSTQRQGKRRAALKFLSPAFSSCPSCGKLSVSHRVCQSCGFYRGKQIITLKVKKRKNENKARPKTSKKN